MILVRNNTKSTIFTLSFSKFTKYEQVIHTRIRTQCALALFHYLYVHQIAFVLHNVHYFKLFLSALTSYLSCLVLANGPSTSHPNADRVGSHATAVSPSTTTPIFRPLFTFYTDCYIYLIL